MVFDALEKMGKSDVSPLCGSYAPLRGWARERDILLDSIMLQRRWAASPLLRCEGIERVIALGCMSLLREASLRLTRESLEKKERYGSEKIRR